MSDLIETFDPADQGTGFRFQSFDSLISPVSYQEFHSRFWEKKAFLVKRDMPGYFDSLLGLQDVDGYLGTRAFHPADIRIVKEGKDTAFADYAKDGIADRAKVMSAFRNGSMLVLSHLNRHHLPLAEVVSRCEGQTHLPMRSNVYLSPPGSRGFNLHWDTHDVLVIQVSGSKRWHVYDNPLPLPHEDQKRDFPKWRERATKQAELLLKPGSVLFLPRGFIHGAESEDEHSLHITFGLRSLTIADIVLRAFREKSLDDPEMRRIALLDDFEDDKKVEAAQAALRRVLEEMDIEGAANQVYKSFIRSRQPPSPGMLLDALRQQELEHDVRLRLRETALFQTFRESDAISLAVDGTVVDLPRGAEQALDYVVGQREFTPGQLPGLEHESKLILSRMLLDCRLVEYA